MDVRWSFISNNSQSSRERAYNTRQLKEQVNPRGLPILTGYIICNLLGRVTMRHCKKNEQLSELYIRVPIIV